VTTAHAGWWRRERRAQGLASNVSGGYGAVATEVLWSNCPLAHQARPLDSKAVCSP
jgi:hypothetical protein